MKIGLVFPQTEIGDDPALVSAYVRTAEEQGFSFLSLYDHVVGADLANRPDWNLPYSLADEFHEVFVLCGFLAAQTTELELVTGILVLPQRNAVLAAKQAAEVDILTRGRFRLGIGIGWNHVECEALGVPFASRAGRYEEQIEVMRRLWTSPSVTFRGEFHDLDAVGISPRPVQQPIPVWLGGGDAPPVLDRIGRLADGWMAGLDPGPKLAAALDEVRRIAEKNDRDPDVPWQGMARVEPGESIDALLRKVDTYREMGASHLGLNAMRGGLSGQAHVDLVGSLGEKFERG